MTKIFCDICKNEMNYGFVTARFYERDTDDELSKIMRYDDKGNIVEGKCRLEICPECFQKSILGLLFKEDF